MRKRENEESNIVDELKFVNLLLYKDFHIILRNWRLSLNWQCFVSPKPLLRTVTVTEALKIYVYKIVITLRFYIPNTEPLYNCVDIMLQWVKLRATVNLINLWSLFRKE